ncbi:MAG: RsmE family RNA methyltransferase [Anaerolineae bacterium]
MHRFFISPQCLTGDQVALSVPLAQRLRDQGLAVGDRIVVLDGYGWAYEVELTALTEGRVVSRALATGERRTKVSLYQGLLAPRAFTALLRRGTELGVVEFVPVISARCPLATLDAFSESQQRRWQQFIRERAEGSGRGRLPRLQPAMLFESACDRATRSGLSLLLLADAEISLESVLQPRPFSINLFVGPPAGFTAQEVDRARRYGAIPVSLGPSPVKAERAGLAASQFIFEQLG